MYTLVYTSIITFIVFLSSICVSSSLSVYSVSLDRSRFFTLSLSLLFSVSCRASPSPLFCMFLSLYLPLFFQSLSLSHSLYRFTSLTRYLCLANCFFLPHWQYFSLSLSVSFYLTILVVPSHSFYLSTLLIVYFYFAICDVLSKYPCISIYLFESFISLCMCLPIFLFLIYLKQSFPHLKHISSSQSDCNVFISKIKNIVTLTFRACFTSFKWLLKPRSEVIVLMWVCGPIFAAGPSFFVSILWTICSGRKLTLASHYLVQCDQIGRFIAIWAIFQACGNKFWAKFKWTFYGVFEMMSKILKLSSENCLGDFGQLFTQNFWSPWPCCTFTAMKRAKSLQFESPDDYLQSSIDTLSFA